MESESSYYYDKVTWENTSSSFFDRANFISNATDSNVTKAIPRRCFTAYFYAMGVIIPAGFICNIFCLIVFTLSVGLRRTTTVHYLTALACADTLFLVGDFMRWISTTECLSINFMHTSQGACKLTYWLRYGAKMVSAWVTVAIAAERLFTVAFPLKVSTVSTACLAKVVITLLVVGGFGLGSFPLWTVSVDDHPLHAKRCVVPKESQEAYENWSMAVLRVGTLGLPGLLIAILTSITVFILIKAGRRRRQHMEGQRAIAPPESSRKTSVRGGSPPERQLTITLICVCVAFVLLRLPYTVTYYLYEALTYREKSSTYGASLRVAKYATDVIATSNYVANLFLYCLCGRYFRQQVLAVFGCRNSAGPSGSTSSTMKEEYSLQSRGQAPL